MKMLRFIISGRITLIFVAILSAIYLYGTFGNENPWDSLIVLIRYNLFLKSILFLLCIHLFLKGIYKVLTGKIRYAASAIFFISLSLIITGIVFSIISGDKKGQRFNVSEKTEEGLSITDIKLGIPDNILVVGNTSVFRIKDVEAVANDNSRKIILKPYPFVRTPSGFAYINDAGISPSFDLSIDNKKILLSKLALLPPNKKVSIPFMFDSKIEISFSPEREFQKGRLTARQYNLLAPRYRVVIKKSDKILFDKVLSDNQIEKGSNIRLKCGATERWVEVVFVRDKIVFILYAGLVGLVLGILLYPLELFLH